MYLSPDVSGNYVDKPYISRIRLWYIRARSLNGLSRRENRIYPVFGFDINYSSRVYPAKWLNKAYMSMFGFGTKYSSQVYLAIILIKRICIIFGFCIELFSHYSLVRYWLSCIAGKRFRKWTYSVFQSKELIRIDRGYSLLKNAKKWRYPVLAIYPRYIQCRRQF